MDIRCQISEASAMATAEMDIVVQRLVSYLSRTQQVSYNVLSKMFKLLNVFLSQNAG